MTNQPHSKRGASRYRPELDALRAVAIIPVVLFHLNSSALPGGYLGVDVFFVLSGYLITGILLRDLDRGAFKLRDFYGRRIRRLGPVILAVVALTLLTATLFLPESGRVYVAQQSVAALLSVSNFFVLFMTGDYWGPSAESTALLHTWSLSVEEQFYLIYPVLLAVVHRCFSRGIIPFLVLVILSSLAVWTLWGATDPSAAFYLLPTRAWELAGGGLIAAWHQSAAMKELSAREVQGGDRRWRAETLACLAGLSMIVIAYVLPSQSGSNEWHVILAVAGTCLFLCDLKSNRCYQLLSQKPLVGLGRMSYSWYMWHWPLIVLNDLTGVYANRWLVGAAGLAVSWASWRWIEQTTRHRTAVVPRILIVFALLLVAAFYLMRPSSRDAVDPSLFQTGRWYGSYYNAYPLGEQSDWYDRVIQRVDVPERIGASEDLIESGITWGEPPPDVVLLGDSHATMWAHLVHRLVQERGRSLNVWTINGMDPLFRDPRNDGGVPDTKRRYDLARRQKLERWKPDLAIISMRWWKRDPDRLEPFVRFVSTISRRVILVGATPELRIGDENAVSAMAERGIMPQENLKAYLPMVQSDLFLQRTAEAKRLAETLSNVAYLELMPRYQHRGEALALVGGYSVYLDDDHLTEFGTSLSTQALAKAIDQALSGDQAMSGDQGPALRAVDDQETRESAERALNLVPGFGQKAVNGEGTAD